MSEQAQTSAQLTPAALVTQLEALSKKWVQEHGGKPNHNPWLQSQLLIQPLILELKAKDAVITPEIYEKVQALPETSPVINPDYVPEKEPNFRPQATAQNSGPLNAGS